MPVKYNTTVTLFIFFTLYAASSTHALAACSEQTLNKLLELGFSPSQVIQTLNLGCGTPPIAISEATPSTQVVTSESTVKVAVKKILPVNIKAYEDHTSAAPTPAVAVAIVTNPTDAVAPVVAPAAPPPTAPSGPQPSQFFSNWSVGLAMLHNNRTIVSDATVINNIVRANTESRWQPELLVAKHVFFSDGDGNCWGSRVCPGLFLGVGLGGSGSSQVIDMAGAGFIFGFGGKNRKIETSQPHNFGIAIGRRLGIKRLGDGIVINATLPPGETQVRYKTADSTAPFFFYTYKFD